LKDILNQLVGFDEECQEISPENAIRFLRGESAAWIGSKKYKAPKAL